MIPSGIIRRTVVPPVSMRKMSPAESVATANGWFKLAAVAGPPLPVEPAVPSPAMVEILPSGVTMRRRLFPRSAMIRSPLESKAIP